MVQFAKLSADQAEAVRSRKVRSGRVLRLREEYDGYLSGLATGAMAEFQLGDGERRNTVRSRVHAAAKRNGVTVRMLRTRGDILRFEVVAVEGEVIETGEDEDLNALFEEEGDEDEDEDE